jgi:pilus assembly protein CpaB
VLAGAIAFIVLPRQYRNEEATVTIVRAAREIPAGSRVEDRDIERVNVGAYNLQAGAIRDSDLVVGQYTLVTMLPGDLFTAQKLSDQQYQTMLDMAISEGLKLVTVSISSIAAGTGGHLRPGDTISVFIFTSSYIYGEQVEKVEAPAILQNLILYDLENSKGRSVGSSFLLGNFTDDDIPRTATFLADARQAQALIAAEYGGNIHLVFNTREG